MPYKPSNYEVYGNYYVTYNPKERTRTIYDKYWNRLRTVDDSELYRTLDELDLNLDD